MVAVNINAGLANQMFHYAFGRGLMAKGLDIVFDQSNFKPRKQWGFEDIKLQDAFPDIEIKAMPEGYFKFVFPEPTQNKFIKLYRRIMIKYHNIIGDEVYIFEPCYGFCENMEVKATKNCIYRGYWQSEKYFKHCEADIRKQFVFRPFDEQKNIIAAEKMSNENSISIHFRKGKDYLQSELMGKNLCGVDYYLHAIEYVKKNVDNPIFYVFTDNINWVKKHITFLKDYVFVDWNECSGKRSFRDMQLMTHCKHNIIANSTYSWWGAWLNPNPYKIVVAPYPFFNPVDDFFKTTDIICENWLKF